MGLRGRAEGATTSPWDTGKDWQASCACILSKARESEHGRSMAGVWSLKALAKTHAWLCQYDGEPHQAGGQCVDISPPDSSCTSRATACSSVSPTSVNPAHTASERGRGHSRPGQGEQQRRHEALQGQRCGSGPLADAAEDSQPYSFSACFNAMLLGRTAEADELQPQSLTFSQTLLLAGQPKIEMHD